MSSRLKNALLPARGCARHNEPCAVLSAAYEAKRKGAAMTTDLMISGRDAKGLQGDPGEALAGRLRAWTAALAVGVAIGAAGGVSGCATSNGPGGASVNASGDPSGPPARDVYGDAAGHAFVTDAFASTYRRVEAPPTLIRGGS